jgi:hypothetical protein
MKEELQKIWSPAYYEKIKEFQAAIKAIEHQETSIRLLIQKDPPGSAYRRLILAEDMLDLASNYLILNDVSLSLLQVKNYAALDAGRKSIFKSVADLEELVSGYVDAAFSQYGSKLRELESVEPERRYGLIRKMGLTIQLLEQAYGDQGKWKWVFVELEGRFAAVAKNIFDLKAAVANTDPRSPHYAVTVRHLRLIKRLLIQSGNQYRIRYELFSHNIIDFIRGIGFLKALRRIHILLGEKNEAEIVKKKIDIWSVKMETDLRKKGA